MEAEDPKFHHAANARSAISTHAIEVHYENSGTAGKLIPTPMMSVLTQKAMHTSTQHIVKKESINDMRGGK